MAETFQGSIAQKNVRFPIETVVTPIPGESYSKAVVFIPLSAAATYLPGVTSPAAGDVVEIKSSNYSTITGARLKNWLLPFFRLAAAASVYVAVYDNSGDNTLTVVFEKVKTLGYFKFAVCEDADYQDVQVQLSTLCLGEPIYSQHWIGTWDENVLTSNSALITALTDADSNSRVIYNADNTINPALAQLGKTLGKVNSTKVPVGNDIDQVAFSGIEASGTGGGNLSPTEYQALDNQKIGYNTYVGDNTGNVVTEGSLLLGDEMVGSLWVKAYIEFVCKVKTAKYVTSGEVFRTNATYQAILGIVSETVEPFVTFGRLADFAITAPQFRELPASGDQIIVPNAWRATYVDNAREVTVYGDLYLTLPTR